MPRWPGNRSPRAHNERGADSTTAPCPQPPATVAAGCTTRSADRHIPPDTPKHVSEVSAQHRSHQGSGPSPEISHRNRVYRAAPDGNPERWSAAGCDIGQPFPRGA